MADNVYILIFLLYEKVRSQDWEKNIHIIVKIWLLRFLGWIKEFTHELINEVFYLENGLNSVDLIEKNPQQSSKDFVKKSKIIKTCQPLVLMLLSCLKKHWKKWMIFLKLRKYTIPRICLLYTSPSPRDQRGSRMPSSA